MIASVFLVWGGAYSAPLAASVAMTELPAPWLLYDPTASPPIEVPIDVNGDAQVDFTIAYDFAAIGIRTERDNRHVIFPSPPPNIGGVVEPLPSGYVIGSSLAGGNSWISSDAIGGYVDPGEQSLDVVTHCFDIGCESRFPYVLTRAAIGIEMHLVDGIHYGYLDVEGQHDTPGLRVYGWAYETEPNTPIIAGSVPEPGRAVLLLFGCLFFFCRRRRALGSG